MGKQIIIISSMPQIQFQLLKCQIDCHPLRVPMMNASVANPKVKVEFKLDGSNWANSKHNFMIWNLKWGWNYIYRWRSHGFNKLRQNNPKSRCNWTDYQNWGLIKKNEKEKEEENFKQGIDYGMAGTLWSNQSHLVMIMALPPLHAQLQLVPIAALNPKF